MPTKVIELLEHCIASSSTVTSGDTAASALNEDSSIYTAKLNITTGVFSVILSNHFNNVLTLNLQMIAGDDSAIKSYLAARMNLSLDTNRRQGMEIAMLKARCEENESVIEELKIATHELRTQKNVDIQSLRAEHSQELSQMQRLALESAEETRQKFEEQILTLKSSLESTQKELHSRTMTTQQTIADLEHDRSQFDFKNRDLIRILTGVESDRDRLLKETEDLHNTRRILEEERAITLRDMTRLESKVEALQQQLKDRDDSMLKSQLLQKASEEAKLTAEERTKLFAQRTEECLSMLNQRSEELQTSQTRVERLTNELTTLKKSLTDKNEVIRQQEHLIQEQRKKNTNLERQCGKSEDDFRRLQELHDRCKRDLIEAKAKLQESQGLIDQNQNVIEYLNAELSRNQLGDRLIAEPALFTSPHAPRTPAAYDSNGAVGAVKTPDTAVGRFMPFSSSSAAAPRTTSASAGGGRSTSPYTPSTAYQAPKTTAAMKGRNLLQDHSSLSQTEDQLLMAKGIHKLGLADTLQEDLGLNLQQMTALAAASSSSAASSMSFGDGNRLWRDVRKGGNTSAGGGVELEEMDYYATTAAAGAASGKMMARAGGSER